MDNLPYNKNLIGGFIAIGAENIVYYYNNNKEVIKFPLIISLRYSWDSEKYCNELKNGYEILKNNLPQSINDSRIYFYKSGGKTKYVVIEPFIDGQALTKSDLEDDLVKKQFLEIIATKNRLETKEYLFLDIFGVWGLFFIGKIKVPNILVEKNTKKLFLIDIGTANLKDSRLIISMLLKFAHWRQNKLLEFYLN